MITILCPVLRSRNEHCRAQILHGAPWRNYDESIACVLKLGKLNAYTSRTTR